MDFSLSQGQQRRREGGRSLVRGLSPSWTVEDLVRAARAGGVFDGEVDGVGDVVALEAAATEDAAAAVALALHTAVVRSGGEGRIGDRVAAVALTSEPVPEVMGGTLVGRASWVAPISPGGMAVVGARQGQELTACLVALDAPGVGLHPVEAAGLTGLQCARVDLNGVAFEAWGRSQPVMAWARLLLAAVGLGIGRRALREALRAAAHYGRTGPGGEQTVQGLVADAATELDAAMVVAWNAAQRRPISLGDASMAKLLATEAAQRAVLRATQVVGLASFERGHVLERLSHDVRALELFAGRTEALRESIADQVLPQARA